MVDKNTNIITFEIWKQEDKYLLVDLFIKWVNGITQS